MTAMNFEPWVGSLGTFTLQGLRWGSHNAMQTVVALHGWQDNAASFIPLASALSMHDSIEFIAIDLPGHGHSDAFPVTQGYSLWDYAQSIILWLNQLKQPVWLLGHSLGGMIAQIIASARPELVKGLITLDILSLSFDSTEGLSVQRMLEVLRALTMPKQHMYLSPNFDHAVARRARIGSPASQAANVLLAQRGFVQSNQGWAPRLDPRVKAGGFMRLTPEGSDLLLNQIQCPWHAILAKEGITSEKRQQEAKLLKPTLRIHMWPGGHHFHMEQNPVELLALIINVMAGEV